MGADDFFLEYILFKECALYAGKLSPLWIGGNSAKSMKYEVPLICLYTANQDHSRQKYFVSHLPPQSDNHIILAEN